MAEDFLNKNGLYMDELTKKVRLLHPDYHQLNDDITKEISQYLTGKSIKTKLLSYQLQITIPLFWCVYTRAYICMWNLLIDIGSGSQLLLYSNVNACFLLYAMHIACWHFLHQIQHLSGIMHLIFHSLVSLLVFVLFRLGTLELTKDAIQNTGTFQQYNWSRFPLPSCQLHNLIRLRNS